jgi:hypothetical protein
MVPRIPIILVFAGFLGVLSTTAQRLTSFTLINAQTNQPIGLIEDNDLIDVQAVGASALSLRANINNNTTSVGSVRFFINGETSAVENVVPYALGGDTDGNYNAVPALVTPGSVMVRATLWSGPDGTGDQLQSVTLTLQVFVAGNADVPTLSPNTVAASTGTDVGRYPASPEGTVSGVRQVWHKVTLGFVGPNTSETATPNPFTDYRLDVTFTSLDSPQSLTVPGYYAADGNAANTGASSGAVWLVHFAPDLDGNWAWEANFTTGTLVAQYGDGSSAGFFDGASGNFSVATSNKKGRDFRARGRLQYVGEHHLKFPNGEWFLKAGADSPENFLAYEDFDNTPNQGGRRKSWAPHTQDYTEGDPTWAGGKGKGMIGALNYLANKGMNAFSFLPMNIEGDDKNVFPYISDAAGEDRMRIDVSKTAQWEVVFERADHLGLFLHFKTQETENDRLLDNGSLGDERRLYYRELVARFGHHLALNWNLGEENRNTDMQRKAYADYFKEIDPYQHPVVVHTFPRQKEAIYADLLGYSTFDGASLQSSPQLVFNDTLEWRTRSAAAGRKWVVANDEQGDAQTGVAPDDVDPTHDGIRENVLWGNLMAGGAGVEYYFGYRYANSDLTCEDWRSRDAMWDLSRYALEFFQNNTIEFWKMSNANDRVSNGWCLAHEDGTMMVVYLIDGGTASIDLAGSTGTTYTSKWFNPRRGGALQDGSVRSLNVGGTRLLGNAPNGAPGDWVVLITLDAASVTPNPVNQPTTSPVVSPIQNSTQPPVVNSSSMPTVSPISESAPSAAPVAAPLRAPTMTTPILAPTDLPTALPLTRAPTSLQPTTLTSSAFSATKKLYTIFYLAMVFL